MQSATPPLTPPVASFPQSIQQFLVDPIRPRIYGIDKVTNLCVFNTETLSLEATIAVGASPQGMGLSPDNSKLYVTSANIPHLSEIDLETLTVRNLPLEHPPVDVAAGLDGRLYVSVAYGLLLQLDSATGAIEETSDQSVDRLELGPDRKTLYSGRIGYTGGVSRFDVSGKSVQFLQAITNFGPIGAEGFALSHDGQLIAYSHQLLSPDHAYSPGVLLSAADLSVLRQLPGKENTTEPLALAFSPDDSLLFQSHAITDGLTIHLYAAASFRLLDTIVVRHAIIGSFFPVTADNSGRYLFSSDFYGTQAYDISPQLVAGPLLLGVRDSAFAYQIQTTFDATSYEATGLPPGLSVSETGLIVGTPSASGEFTASVTGTRGAVQASQSYSFKIDGNRLKNLSTRAYTAPNELALIGGFIIEGSVPKAVVVRVLGPSLAAHGVTRFAKNPFFRLYDSNGYELLANNDWADTDDQDLATLVATGLAPDDPVESAVATTLDPGAYTVVLQPGGGGAENDYNGNALFEVYDVDSNTLSKLGNVSTRSYTDPLSPEIAGVIVSGPGDDNVLIRALGPSLAASGVNDPIHDPMVELHDANGALLAVNNNWRETQEAEITATGLTPADDLEAAIFVSLPAGLYTAVLQNTYADFGVCLVEVYHLP